MAQELNYTQQEIADKVGKDRASVANYLRLLKLPKEIQENLAEEKISMGHARALIGLEDPKLQVSLSRQIIQKQLSVRDVEKLIQRLNKPLRARQISLPDPDLAALQEEFTRLLGTKIIISGNQNKGVIRIHYFSLDELNRIYGKIKGAKE
jgi:ParB family chromosome partitioning protein